MDLTKYWILSLLLLSILMSSVSALKIALMPMIFTSHAYMMDVITQHLITRGHETVTIFPNEPSQIKKLKPSPLALFDIDIPVRDQVDAQKMYTAKESFRIFQDLFDIQGRYCDVTLANKTLIQSLNDVDVVISDSLYVCSILLPEVIQKPFIILSFTGTVVGIHTFMGAYAPTSYIPNVALPIHSFRMSFLQRVMNVVAGNAYANTVLFMSSKLMNELRYKHNISTHLTLFELRRKFSMFLSTNDFCIEFPRPLPPNIKLVGPTSMQPASPLSSEFEQYMQSSPNGVILFSFGSELQLDSNKLPQMVQALGQLPYNIIWKTLQKIDNVPKNVKIVKWMPQNDILGHDKTVAFITHCGIHSLYEAVYHGVPIIGMPAMLEQNGNAVRMVTAGFGLRANFYSFKASDIVDAVKEVTTNKKYKQAALKMSKIIKSSRRSGRDAIVDWTEYVYATDGAHHLKVEGENLYLYELYNLDVFLFIFACLYVLYRMMTGCIRILRGSAPKSKSD